MAGFVRLGSSQSLFNYCLYILYRVILAKPARCTRVYYRRAFVFGDVFYILGAHFIVC